jgi:hypothetical protein
MAIAAARACASQQTVRCHHQLAHVLFIQAGAWCAEE